MYEVLNSVLFNVLLFYSLEIILIGKVLVLQSLHHITEKFSNYKNKLKFLDRKIN